MKDPRASTPSDAIRMMIERFVDDAHVAMPARVVEYYPEEQKVDVQPLPKLIYSGMAAEDMFEIPVLWSVPVLWPRVDSTASGGPKCIMYMPIMKDSLVLLVFNDFCLDNFLLASGEGIGATYDPQSISHHDINEAVAIPGFFPYASKVPATDSSKGTAASGALVDPHDVRIVLEWPDKNIRSEIYLGGDTGDIVLYPSRNVALGNPKAANDPVPKAPLKSWLQAILAQIEAICDAAMNATYGDPIDDPTAFQAAKDELTSLMTRFDQEDPVGAMNSFGVTTNKVKIP